MKNLPLLRNLNPLTHKKILVRLDLNVPIKDGVIGDRTRIERAIPTLKYMLDGGAKIAICSHLGRPKGKVVPEFSLRPLLAPLSDLLGVKLGFVDDLYQSDSAHYFDESNIVLFENLRFHSAETENDPDFAKRLAAGFDYYVNDAFSCAHRAHASVHGIVDMLPSVAGLSLEAEVNALSSALNDPKRPVMAVIGGAKISTKIPVLEFLLSKLDYMVIGGGMANGFLAAQGKNIGKSLCEQDMIPTAAKIMNMAAAANCEILLPLDAAVATKFEAGQPRIERMVDDVQDDELILDVGAKTIEFLQEKLAGCSTLLWNGPLGVFELAPFDHGTNKLAEFAAQQTNRGQLISVAGGGDTVAALNHGLSGVAEYKNADDAFTYISTAGGAFLEWLEGKDLPGIDALINQT